MKDMLNGAGSMKRKNKVTGFDVRILDDKSYVLKTQNQDYSMCKEYSYEDVDDLKTGIDKIIGKVSEKDSKEEDALEKKSE